MNQLISQFGEQINTNAVLQEHPRPRLVRDNFWLLNGPWHYQIVSPCAKDMRLFDTYLSDQKMIDSQASSSRAEKVEDDSKTSSQFSDQELACFLHKLQNYGDLIKQGEIIVPFSPEAYLSGVGHILQKDELLLYRKSFSGWAGRKVSSKLKDFPVFWPKEKGDPDFATNGHWLLHFGAVDQEALVFANGVFLGSHRGGYTSFSFDLSEALIRSEAWSQYGEIEICLIVRDQTEFSPHARGKQKLFPRGMLKNIFYTPNSGIWKPVWLEFVPRSYIEELEVTPDLDRQSVRLKVKTNTGSLLEPEALSDFLSEEGRQSFGEAEVIICDAEKVIWQQTIPCEQEVEIPLPMCVAWTPENPKLYDLRVQYLEDLVYSYFAIRKISYETDKRGILRFYLNNQPYFLNGLLDQGYWPESLLTPPSDEALIFDIESAKRLGYNTLRKHIKVEEERFYYHCDRLGMLVIQDIPNGGGELPEWLVSILPTLSHKLQRSIRDKHYAWFSRTSEFGRDQYVKDLEQIVRQLKHYPSLIAYVPFNEGWGQFDANLAVQFLFDLDPSRLVIGASGWFDQHGGDVYSIHNYFGRLKVKPQPDRVVALTEFGGYAYAIKGHTMFDQSFGYKKFACQEDLLESYLQLIKRDVIGNLSQGLSAAIYTQLSDVEKEVNGLLTYDRRVLKFDSTRVLAINQELYQVFSELVRKEADR